MTVGKNVEKVAQKSEKVDDGGEDSDKVTQKNRRVVQESLSSLRKWRYFLHCRCTVYRSSLITHFF